MNNLNNSAVKSYPHTFDSFEAWSTKLIEIGFSKDSNINFNKKAFCYNKDGIKCGFWLSPHGIILF
jgi:hypothetical protein